MMGLLDACWGGKVKSLIASEQQAKGLLSVKVPFQVDFNINKSAVLLINQIVYSGKSFLLAFLLARYFDKSSFGVYSFVMICLNNSLGFLSSLVYEPLAVLRNGVTASYAEVTAYLFRRQNQLNGVILLFIVVLAVLKVFNVPSLVLIFFFFAASQMHEFLKRIYLNQLDTRASLCFDVVLAGSQLLTLFALSFQGGLTIDKVFLSLSLGCIPTLAFGFMKHRKILFSRRMSPERFDAAYYKYVKPNLVFSFVSFGSSQLNNFVIFLILGGASLANCEAVRLLLVPLHITILAMNNILLPYFSKWTRLLDAHGMRTKSRGLLSLFFAVFLLMAGLVYLSGPLLLEAFYKGKYAQQTYLLGIYALIYVFDGLNLIVTYYLKALGLIHVGIYIRLALIVINIVMLVPLVWFFREAGGLLATLAVGVLMFFSYYIALLKRNRI